MNWTLALPEAALACAGLAILGAGVLPRRHDMFFPISMAVIGALVLAGVLVLGQGDGAALAGQYVSDAFARFSKVLVLIGAALALTLALDFNQTDRDLARFEYPVLILFAAIGMMLMVSANDLMTLYLGLELQSLAAYVLAAFNRDSERSAEAGLKYFVLGALASGLLLYGMSLVYGFVGTTSFDRLAEALTAEHAASLGLVTALVFVLAGLAFKISAVPFHMWAPDVYEGAPTPVTAFFASAPKLAAVALLTRVLTQPFGELSAQWGQVLWLVSAGSMILGAFAAIGQRNIKRLMAYSSIGNVGYALIGLVAAASADPAVRSEGVRALLFYMAIYLLMTIGAFAVLAAMRRRGRPVEEIEDLAGLARSDIGMAVWMLVFMFAMAGVPPLAGFWSKLFVFRAAIEGGYVWLAVIGVLTSVVAAYYYVRIVRVMFFDAPGAAGALDARPASLTVVMAATGLFTALFSVAPGPLLAAAQAAVAAIAG
ncbi:NADH-quinone oxidoreductase subunit NuoN [Caldovatus aquaticus]|uniref:NADH-quinone oxidoreductase subunit N n=1 Tax=Caldovatus aquaticus TaxID=2865671 RepID=A0ABS7EYQ2_9PROT|nr:NADH-quinone oxidoreductase subunit NuoN [Caldovatus aquaticus]MBW8268488.1 NADH-quinone oxidoreductase subunit NuoN [Caldovatus aquaticus]